MRQCRGTTKSGKPCKQWAVWGDELQRCAGHGGRIVEAHTTGKTHAPACHCAAWNFPHRPGSGPCRWPDPPLQRVVVKKMRDRDEKRTFRVLKKGRSREPWVLFWYRMHVRRRLR